MRLPVCASAVQSELRWPNVARISQKEVQASRANRDTFVEAIANDPDGKDRYGRINQILNPRVLSAFTEEGRRRFALIDWSK
jgi:hypothetical protein